MKKLPVIAGTVAAAVGLSVPAVLLAQSSATAAADEAERSTACGQGRLELGADRERSGIEVDADLDDAKPGSTWKVVLRHDGDKVLTRTLTADHEGDADLDVLRPDTSGQDVFTVRAKQVGSDAKACKVTVTLR
jgi:hypothetical protein